MIEKLQKFFHTDKWWGGALLYIFLYVTYWTLFYIIIPFIIMAIQGFNFGGFVLFFNLLILAPILSLKILKILLKILKINKYLLYIIHIILIIIPLFLYWIFILIAIRNGFS